MKIRILLAALFTLANAEELTWLHGRVDSFQVCPSDHVVRGLCGSGKNKDCHRDGHSSYTSTGCGSFPTPDDNSSRQGALALSTSAKGLNGWNCVKYGVNAECPPGFVMVGACGSGEDEDCRQFCNPHTHAAIKCAPAPNAEGVDSGYWSVAQRYGKYFQCGANEVVCGACQSGKNKDCNGGHFRVKCCTAGEYNIVGRWNYVRTVVGSTSLTLRHGTAKSSSKTKSEEWSLAVTRSVEAGFEVKGIGAKQSLSIEASMSYASEYSEEWSSSEETEFTFSIDESEQGKALWQWVFDISDPYSNLVTTRAMDYALTEGRDKPPRCQPGFSAGLSVDYQECTSDSRILPGFDIPTRVEYQKLSGKACRTSSFGRGVEGTDYFLIRGIPEERCENLCSDEDFCRGWEYSRDRCELWQQEPTRFETKPAIDCYVKIN